MDVLFDVLRTIRLEGALFLNAELYEPWCVDAPSGAHLAQVLSPRAEHLAVCHFVLEGMATTFGVIEFVVEYLLARLAHRIRPVLERAGTRFNRVCGGMFVAMGAALPMAR